jgi:hypothetical protein
MGVRQIMCATLLAAVTVTAPRSACAAISIGEPQAMRSSAAPYVFRVPLAFQPQDPGETAAVTVHSPADAVALVRTNMLELRLRRLTDVEIEVSYAGQTLNRLVLVTELQRARAPLEATTAWKRYQAAKAGDQSTTRLAALLDTALALHHAWARLDPAAAQQSLALVSQEQAALRPASRQQAAASPVQEPAPQAATPAVEATPLDDAWRALRAELQMLVRGVPLWNHEVSEVPLVASRTDLVALTMLLGGLWLVGMVWLVRAYLRQRRALARERQRRRLLSAALRSARQALPPSALALPKGAPAVAPGPHRTRLKSVAVVRRLQVSHSTRRQLQRRPPSARQGTARPPSLPEQTRVAAHLAWAGVPAPEEPLAALKSLRHELISLQLRLPASQDPADSDAGCSQVPHG